MIANTQPTRSIATMVCWSTICTGLITSAALGGGGGGWGNPETDGSLEIPDGTSELGAAFGLTPANELLVGDPGANRVVIYHHVNIPIEAPNDKLYPHPVASIVEPDIDPDARFGSSIAVWGGAALVGAPGEGNGRVYILLRDSGPYSTWSVTGFIDPPEDDWEGFGAAIALDAPYVLIGAPDGVEEGVGRYMINSGNINHHHSWVSPFPAEAGFGSAVALNGTRALIGAPDADNGHALLYAQGESEIWDFQGDYADWAPLGGRLGASVNLSNRFAAVAVPDTVNPNGNNGIVWLYKSTAAIPWDTDDPGEEGWAMPPSEYSGGVFGASMTNTGNTLIIGHPDMSDGGGAAHIYELRAASTANVAAWTDSISGNGGDLGSQIVAAEPLLWIAADVGADGYLLNDGEIRTSADVTATVSAQTIPTGTDWIPESLDVEGRWLAAGSSADNEVIVMAQIDDEWALNQVLNGPEEDSYYGVVVRLLDGVLIVGAPEAAGGDGRVYLYTLDEKEQWELKETITPAPVNGGNKFGFALDACRDHLGRLVLAVSSPAITFDAPGGKGLPTQFDEGRFDLYRIESNATSYLWLHSWTEPEALWDGVFLPAIATDGEDLVIAVGRVFRGVEDTENPPLTWGGITIFRGGPETDSDWVEEADFDAPENRGAFMPSDIASGIFTAIAPYHHNDLQDYEVNESIMVYEQASPSEPWGATQELRTPDINYAHDFGGAPRLGTLFGHQAIIAGSPRLQSSAGLAGSAEIFLRPGDAEYGTHFKHHLRLTVDGHHDVRLGSNVAIDGDNLFFAGGLFTSDDQYAGESGLIGWGKLTNTAYWNNAFGGIWEDPANWTIDPAQADQLEISILDPNLVMMVSDGTTLADKNVHVRYTNCILREENSDDSLEISNWTIWGDAAIQMARSGSSGTVNVANNLQLGHADGDAGRFWSVDWCRVTAGGTYTQASSGTLDYWFPGDEPDEPIITASNLELGGTLSLFMPNPDYALQLGDTFPLLRADTAPDSGANRFDLIVLPGLADNLAMQVMYDDGGGDSLAGDTWDVWIEIIELGGLMGFGDTDSIDVSGLVIDLEVVDLNNDGADEVCVLLDGTPGQLFIFQDNGAGGIESQFQFSTINNPTCIASGDFDANTFNDLAIGSLHNEVQLFWNDDGDMSTGFTPESIGTIGPVTCATSILLDSDAPIDLMVGIDDVNGDGSGSLQWWFGFPALNNAGGGLAGGGDQDTPGIPWGLDPSKEEDQKSSLCFCFFDNGSGADVAGNGTLGSGSFTLDLYVVGADPIGIARADLDSDGIDDLAITSETNGTVAILRGTITGYLPALQVPIGNTPSSIVAIDFNEDEMLDLAIITHGASGAPFIHVLQNEGNMQFTTVDTGASEVPALLATGDVNGDGTVQLVSIGSGASLTGPMSLIALHNVDMPICPGGDIDGNGTVNVDDLMALIGQWGNDCEGGEDCTGDLDGNLLINVDDLVLLIGVWGPC